MVVICVANSWSCARSDASTSRILVRRRHTPPSIVVMDMWRWGERRMHKHVCIQRRVGPVEVCQGRRHQHIIFSGQHVWETFNVVPHHTVACYCGSLHRVVAHRWLPLIVVAHRRHSSSSLIVDAHRQRSSSSLIINSHRRFRTEHDQLLCLDMLVVAHRC